MSDRGAVASRSSSSSWIAAASLIVSCLLALPIAAEDAYFTLRLDSLDLQIEQDSREVVLERIRNLSMPPPGSNVTLVALDGEGEAYLRTGVEGAGPGVLMHLRAPLGAAVRGELHLPDPSGKDPISCAFRVSPELSSAEARIPYYEAMEGHYQQLLQEEIAGAAWFRHRLRVARQARGLEAPTAAPEREQLVRARRRRGTDLQTSYDVFTGGRALSENLDLDRLLEPGAEGEATVAIKELSGIEIRALDWQPLIKGKTPTADSLARLIPADQHAVFFPSFDAMISLIEEMDRHGTPVLDWMELRAEDARVRDRYERQLCLPLDVLARTLGPAVVSSVALSGSDPYLRTGSDLALLFEPKNAGTLAAFIAARQAAARSRRPDARAVQLEVDGISVVGVTTPDRWLSSFLATIDGVVVVSNSIPQLQRIAETAAGGHASLRDLPEYTFFRDRYRRGDPDESALLILSDATIRRWCGPRWRIGASRRTRAAATLSELQARWMEDLAARGIERAGGALSGELLQVDFPHPELEKLTVTPEGVMSSSYGTLEFLTPILELSIEKVTPSEAAAYRQYRDRYQRRWPRFFDPIAVRVSLTAERVAVDTTVMPLIDRSEYREYIDLASGARIGLRDGDPHPGTILHVVTSLNPEGRMVRMLEGFLHSPASPFNPHPLAWMGNYCALYLDADPEWERVVRAAETRDERVAALRTEPLGVSIAVRDPLRLAGFLTLLRGLSAVAAPEMLVWESREHNGQSYVKVQLSAPMAGDPQEEELALYYAPTKRILHLSLREDVLHRALDRTREGLEGEAKADPSAGNGDAWLGENLALKVNRRVLDVARTLFRDTYQQRMQHRSFGNLAILNEWKRLYPHENPIALHERIWKTRLRCPGGGNYAWNERFQTMESTIYGHPADPRAGAKFPLPLREIHSLNLGVTFENDGLRAHAQIVREQ